MTKQDYERFDLLIGMEQINIRNMNRIIGGDPDSKMHLLLDYTTRPGDVVDPWYTRNFNTAWDDIYEGCLGLLHHFTD